MGSGEPKVKKPIHISIVGAGWIGRVHSEAFRRIPLLFDLGEHEIKLRYGADIDRSLAESLSQKYGYEKWTTDWRHLIEDKETDIIDICTPNFLHKEIAIEAARHGKHIICEKPLAASPGDSREMLREVEKAKVKHLVNFNYRKIPGITYLKSLIDQGELGKLFLIRAYTGLEFGLKMEATQTWRFDSSQSGGGSFVTQGSHVVDMVRYLCGEIEAIAAATSSLPRNGGSSNVEDQTILTLKHENGAMGSIISTWLAHGRKHHFEFEINAEKASIFFNSERLNELQAAFGSDEEARQGFRTIYIGQPHPYGPNFDLKTGMGIGIKETFIVQFYEFIRSILQDLEPSPSFYDGWWVDEVIEKAYRSARSGQWEKIGKWNGP
jgi:predicted dehydrogenase